MNFVFLCAIINKGDFMQRYFINNEQINNNLITIIGEDVHHIKTVMRMRTGEEVMACTEEYCYLCEIELISNDIVRLHIKETIKENNELPVEVSIAQGLVRREKTEEVIRRITELGACEYIPVVMKRSVVKANNEKLDRWGRIVKEASEQSHRNKLLKISSSISLKDLIKRKDEFDLCLFAHFDGESKDLNYYINNKEIKKILVLVGPEGGFDQTEVDLLKSSGFKVVSLGKRVLRTETAPLFLMSVLSNEFEEKI